MQKAALAAHITLFNEHNERGELHFTNIEHYTHFTSYNGKDTHTDNKIISEIFVLHSSAPENKTFSHYSRQQFLKSTEHLLSMVCDVYNDLKRTLEK